MRTMLIGGLLALLALAAPVAAIQAQAPRQTDLFPPVAFRGVTAPARYFYLAQAVVEYGPGAFSAAGSEQSLRYFTILEGELTFTVAGKQASYAAGKSFSVAPGIIVRGSNEGRGSRARVFVSSLVPARGDEPLMVSGTGSSSPAPRVVCASRRAMGPLPQTIDVVQWGRRYDPGFATPPHIMNEAHDILHLEGTTSYEYVDGGAETYGPCQRAEMYVGQPGRMANRTAVPSIFFVTWLAGPGKPLTSAWQGY